MPKKSLKSSSVVQCARVLMINEIKSHMLTALFFFSENAPFPGSSCRHSGVAKFLRSQPITLKDSHGFSTKHARYRVFDVRTCSMSKCLIIFAFFSLQLKLKQSPFRV